MEIGQPEHTKIPAILFSRVFMSVRGRAILCVKSALVLGAIPAPTGGPMRKRAWWVLFPFIFGIFGLFLPTLRSPFQVIRTVDGLRLLACGMCFGVALVSFLMPRSKPPREGE